MGADKPEVLVLDTPAQFQALSLPARFAAFDELFSSQRPTTATALSVTAGVSPSSMSYHLRELERHGLVRRAGDATDGRTRLWEAPAQVYEVVASGIDDPAARLALVDAYLGPMRTRMATRLAERSRSEDDGLESGETVLANGKLSLSEDGLRALQAEIVEVWRRYEQASWDDAAVSDADRVEVFYMWSLLRG